ncbi:hypothetical protein AGLY_017830 [Aphis glycines]|uniref:Integrase catalytic domain-containing protein n=1 Tax=Aphis glycines TaxID=307491 RepID=A0A6G0STZ4_APHGL|nr:hypothetical protein AGLY_017830 [Aphis glycines]
MDYCEKCKSQTRSIEDYQNVENPARKHFETRHFIQRGINDTWQADLYCFYRPKVKTDDPSYSLRNKHNANKAEDNYKTLYKINDDTFSKYVWSVPLKTKTGLEVANAFSQIFKYDVPKILHVDKGTDKKASIIERFNRTLGDKLKKNNKNDVSKKNENDLLSTVYNYDISNSKPKFEINDRVRLSSINDVYRNKLKTNWSKEIFIVEKIFKSNVNYYKIYDMEGTVYEEELLLSPVDAQSVILCTFSPNSSVHSPNIVPNCCGSVTNSLFTIYLLEDRLINSQILRLNLSNDSSILVLLR